MIWQKSGTDFLMHGSFIFKPSTALFNETAQALARKKKGSAGRSRGSLNLKTSTYYLLSIFSYLMTQRKQTNTTIKQYKVEEIFHSTVIGLQTQELTGWNLKPAHHKEGKDKVKKEAGHSRLVGGKFNKDRNLYARLVLGTHKIRRSLYLPGRILKVYIETLTGFRHIYYPDGFNKQHFTLSQLCPWNSSSYETGGLHVHSKLQRNWKGAANCPGSGGGSSSGHILSMTSSKNNWNIHFPPHFSF